MRLCVPSENLVLLSEQGEDCLRPIFSVPPGLTSAFLGTAVEEKQEHLQDVGEVPGLKRVQRSCRILQMHPVSHHYHRSLCATVLQGAWSVFPRPVTKAKCVCRDQMKKESHGPFSTC